MSEEPKKPMEYGMVGDDGLTMEQRLEKYSGIATWEYLRAACMYEVLFYVDATLPLKTVANAFLDDEADQIKEWMLKGDIVKLEKLHLAHFDQDREKKFDALVVSPFVLCKEVPEKAE